MLPRLAGTNINTGTEMDSLLPFSLWDYANFGVRGYTLHQFATEKFMVSCKLWPAFRPTAK